MLCLSLETPISVVYELHRNSLVGTVVIYFTHKILSFFIKLLFLKVIQLLQGYTVYYYYFLMYNLVQKLSCKYRPILFTLRVLVPY